MYIIIRPRFDEVTHDTFEEAADAIEYMKGKNVPFIDLAEEDAVREKVEGVLKENLEADVCHYDHGTESSWIDNDERACVDLENAYLLKGRAAYAQNCSSAKRLGVLAWEEGCEAYFGYTEIFIYTSDAKAEFKKFVNEGIKRHIDGLSWKQCLEKTKKLATDLIDLLVKTGRAMGAAAMRWDRDHLHCWGEGVEEPPKECPVSRFIARVFGERVLSALRQIREELVLMISINA